MSYSAFRELLHYIVIMHMNNIGKTTTFNSFVMKIENGPIYQGKQIEEMPLDDNFIKAMTMIQDPALGISYDLSRKFIQYQHVATINKDFLNISNNIQDSHLKEMFSMLITIKAMIGPDGFSENHDHLTGNNGNYLNISRFTNDKIDRISIFNNKHKEIYIIAQNKADTLNNNIDKKIESLVSIQEIIIPNFFPILKIN